MELGNNSQVNVQLALNDIAERHVIREPELISRLNKLSIAEIISYSGLAEEYLTYTAYGAIFIAKVLETQNPAPPVANQNEEFWIIRVLQSKYLIKEKSLYLSVHRHNFERRSRGGFAQIPGFV